MVLGRILKKRYHFESCSSTNDVLKEITESKTSVPANSGIYVTTDFQTAGRGHGANSWHSSRGENLLVSFLCNPVMISPELQFDISRIISLSIFDLLEDILNKKHKVTIKWPNDLFVNGSKIAGLLIENRLAGNRILDSIIGIGLNINETLFPDEIPGATSLKKLTGKTFDPDNVLRDLITMTANHNKKLQSYDHKSLHVEYDNKLYGRDRQNVFSAGETIFSGRITGTDPNGMLAVIKEDGFRKFGFKEIAMLKEA